VVGTSRYDVPARVQRAERAAPDVRVTSLVAPLNAARTAQRHGPAMKESHRDSPSWQGLQAGVQADSLNLCWRLSLMNLKPDCGFFL